MTQARSRFGRLYLYSKDDLIRAQENFTTEALRMTIEDDRKPMLTALSALDKRKAEAMQLHERAWRPRSQVELPPRGWLDLVIELLDDERALTGEIWVEVKIDAPQSGQQLSYYADEACRRGHPVWIVTLAKEPVDDGVPNLSWSVLYQKARRGSPDRRSWRQHPCWNDFCVFLEEQGVTNDALGPVSDAEAASLEPSYQLMNKVAEVVKTMHSRAPSLVPGLPSWTSTGVLLNFVGTNFRASGDMIGQNGPVGYGLTAEDATAYWKVDVDPVRALFTLKQAETTRRAAAAARASLGGHWECPPSGNCVLLARRRAGSFDSHEEVVAWMEDRLRELAASSVLSALLASAPTPPAGAVMVDAAGGAPTGASTGSSVDE